MAVLPPSGYAAPEPSIEEVQRRADKLFHEAEQAQERLNTIRVELKDARKQMRVLKSDVARQQATVDRIADRVGDMVAVQAQTSSVGLTSQMLSSGDIDSFLDGVAAMQSYSTMQAGLLSGYQDQAAELRLRKRQLQKQVDAIAKAKEQAAEEYQTVKDRSEAAQKLLDELEAEQQQPDVSRDDNRPTQDVQASGNAQAAVDFAMAQVGEPYVYGAAGPDSWDCSGLTMAAWAEAGVALSHSSSVQATQGTPVSLSEAVPGDLIFYYDPISHVAMYLGNGQIVHATHPGDVVSVDPVDSMPITSIRHIG